MRREDQYLKQLFFKLYYMEAADRQTRRTRGTLTSTTEQIFYHTDDQVDYSNLQIAIEISPLLFLSNEGRGESLLVTEWAM